MSTAGEIEARETTDRLKITAEERAKKLPDLGWDQAVFAEKAVSISFYGDEKGENESLVII